MTPAEAMQINRHFIFTFLAGCNLYDWCTTMLEHSDPKGNAIYSQAQNIYVFAIYLLLAATKAHHSSKSNKSGTLVQSTQETSCASVARLPVILLTICWSFVYG